MAQKLQQLLFKGALQAQNPTGLRLQLLHICWSNPLLQVAAVVVEAENRLDQKDAASRVQKTAGVPARQSSRYHAF